MQDIYTIETNPETGKKIRICWDDLQDINDRHGNNWAEYGILGFGEDGSSWGGSIQGDGENFEDDPEYVEMEKGADPASTVGLQPPRYLNYTGYWDASGNIITVDTQDYRVNALGQPVQVEFPTSVEIKVNIKDWFNEMLGKFPNINPKKGPFNLKNEKFLENNPRIKHQRSIGRLPWDLDFSDIKAGKNKNFKIINNGEQETIAATGSAILFSLVSKIASDRQDDKQEIATSMINQLL